MGPDICEATITLRARHKLSRDFQLLELELNRIDTLDHDRVAQLDPVICGLEPDANPSGLDAKGPSRLYQ